MELTGSGIAQAVFDRMEAQKCDEQAAITYVHGQLFKNPKHLKELWSAAGLAIIRQWTGDALRGYLGSGPRPSAPLNYGTNRRKERRAILPWAGCLIRLPDGTIKQMGDLTSADLGLMVEERRAIANRNSYHADELSHVRSLVPDGQTVGDSHANLDTRAHDYLTKVARIDAA